MRQATSSSRTYTQHATTDQNDTICVSLRIHLGPTQLQCKPFCMWDAKSKRISPQESARCEHPTPPVVTTLAMLGNTTGATRSTSVTQQASKLV